MPAVPGKGGRLPKRSTQVMGHRSKAEMSRYDKVQVSGKVEIPAASPDWHPIVRNWFESLKKSGQSQFFEPSDWASAMFVGEAMHRCIKVDGAGMNANLFTGAWSAMSDLLSTEGARRRLRLELERNKGEEKSRSVAAIDAYRNRLAG